VSKSRADGVWMGPAHAAGTDRFYAYRSGLAGRSGAFGFQACAWGYRVFARKNEKEFSGSAQMVGESEVTLW
jgi:hypothetical protein